MAGRLPAIDLMTKEELQRRTKQFGPDVIELTRELSCSPAADHITGQLIKSGTAVGANYRASCRAKSKADFISKMGTVEEEADESVNPQSAIRDPQYGGS